MNNINSISNQNTNLQKKLPSPAEFLRQAVGRKVVVKLHNNNEYKGTRLRILL